jgi:hypothetical protein
LIVVNIHHKLSIYLALTRMDHLHRLRGFKLTISMSFGEYVFSAGFNQKTIKEDLFIKGNHVNPRWY